MIISSTEGRTGPKRDWAQHACNLLARIYSNLKEMNEKKYLANINFIFQDPNNTFQILLLWYLSL
jgi:hypothetical protein